MTTVVVLADTHIRRSSTRRLPDEVYDALDRADLVLHAGDVLIPEFLDELSGFAPTEAVLGNNDGELLGVLPEERVLEVAGVRIGMIHDSGQAKGRDTRMRRRFPDAGIVVFGHSHIPWNRNGLDGQLLFNPGSATERRMQPLRTYGVLEIDRGRLTRAAVVPLPQ